MPATERVSVTPAQQFKKEYKSVQYQLKQIIGKGSYGVVYKAVNKKTSQEVAIKEVNYQDDEELLDIMSEIDLLKNLNHVNIVKYHGFIQKQHNLYIILEYCSMGSLKSLLTKNRRPLNEREAQLYVKQTLCGLNYLHEQGVIHRDIKAANILLDSHNTVKLADFGVSTMVNNTAMTLAGSLNWMAPEIIGNRGASTLSDIWSLGATVVELLTSNPPFHNLVDMNIYYAIENDTYFPPSSFSKEVKDFLQQCFAKNMYKRPTAIQLLQHPWITKQNNNDDKIEVGDDNEEKNLNYDNVLTPTSSINKLDRYRENLDESDYCWDEDFADEELNLSSPSKNKLVKKSKNPKNKSQVRIGNKKNKYNSNSDIDDTDTTINDSDIINDSTGSDNGSRGILLDRSYFTKLLKSGSNIDNIPKLFQKCSIDTIALLLIDYGLNFSQQGHVSKSDYEISYKTHEKNLYEIFSFDESTMNGRFKRKFIQLGGITTLFKFEKVLSMFFLDDYTDDLIKAGIIPYIKKYKDPSIILSIINKHMELLSVESWCDWCNFNLPLTIILDHLIERRAQSILLKVSMYGTKEFKNEILMQIIKYKITDKNMMDPQVLYVIFKSVFYILRSLNHQSNMTQQSSLMLSVQSHTVSSGSNDTAIPSLSSSPTKSPVSSWKNQSPPLSPSRTLSGRASSSQPGNSGTTTLSSLTTGVEIPDEVFSWMETFLKSKYFLGLMDLHVWKYYNRAFYYVTVSSKTRLLKLLCDEYYIRFCLRVADTISEKNAKQIMGQSSLLLIKMSNEILSTLHTQSLNTKPLMISPYLIKIATLFLTGKNFIYAGIEIILNCFQYAIHQNEDNMGDTFNKRGNRGRASDRLSVVHSDKLLFTEENILVDMKTIVDAFYNLPEKDANFGNFIVKFTKLCTLQPLENLCVKIILEKDFYNKIVSYFELYCNSLLIQIDLLKFIKLLFSRALNSGQDREAILESLKSLLAFLSENWDPTKTTNKSQVGYNSVLIKQLCSDIAVLLTTRPNIKRPNGLTNLGISQLILNNNQSSAMLLDRDRLSIPKPHFPK